MKRYEDLDITDNFMFSKVFSNEDVAKDFLQDILKISIEKNRSRHGGLRPGGPLPQERPLRRSCQGGTFERIGIRQRIEIRKSAEISGKS